MFSIVIPLYNKEAFIEKAINSVLRQSFTKFELLIIDDGSTDSSIDKISTFNDPRIKLISQEHSGVSVARNKGVEKAQYNWIAFLDADDWWETSFLNTIVKAMEIYPDYKLFATGRTHVFNSKGIRYHHPLLPDDGAVAILDYIEVIGKGGLPPINCSNVITDKVLILKEGGFKLGMSAHEDHDLWLRLCVRNDVVFVNKPLSFYRKSKGKPRRAVTYSDFLGYLETMAGAFEKLNPKRRRYLKSYCSRFIPWTFWKNMKTYNSVEKKRIIRKSKALIFLPSDWILWILYRF